MSLPTSELVPSLVQGISQQAPFSRAVGAVEDQENCLNDLLRGARSRNGGKVIASGETTLSDPWLYRIERSQEEDYAVALEGGEFTIFNLADGTECSVTVDADVTSSGYLSNTGSARKAFCAGTVKDTTFLANRQKTCAMATDRSPDRGNFGIAHFKAAAYSTEYKLTVTQGASSWTATYKTPDNSTAANADFIATNRLAAEFGQALDSALPSSFSVFWKGSSILIEHDTTEFSLESSDGLGGDQLKCFTSKVKKTTDLPQTAWDGYIVAVGGNPDEVEATDFYIEYEGDGDTGSWVEVVKWDTPTALDAGTMPVQLINTGLNTFTVSQATWGERLAGDGVDSSKDPSFIGSTIRSIEYNEGRLCLVTQDGYVLSRSNNGFVYFPDTAQTTLDTDPIDATNASGAVAEISSSIVAGEQIQVWANKSQTRIDAGDQRLTEEFIANRLTTTYAYDGETKPVAGGQSSVFFGSGRGDFVWFTEVLYRGNVPRGEIEFNSQCAELIPGRLRHLEAASDNNMLFVLSTEADNTVYLYQWYNQGNDRVQSAWNKWTFPAVSKVLGVWARQTTSLVLLKWPSGDYTLEAVPLGYRMDSSGSVPIRLDHQVNEEGGTYEDQAANGSWPCVIDLPYVVPEADRPNWRATSSVTNETSARGVALVIEWLSASQVRVFGNEEDHSFFFGRIPVAIQEPTELFITRDGQTLPSDRLLIKRAVIHHKDSASYKVEINGIGSVETFNPSRANIPNNQVALSGGKFQFTVGLPADEAGLRLVNDGMLPSAWGAIKYIVEVTSEEQ